MLASILNAASFATALIRTGPISSLCSDEQKDFRRKLNARITSAVGLLLMGMSSAASAEANSTATALANAATDICAVSLTASQTQDADDVSQLLESNGFRVDPSQYQFTVYDDDSTSQVLSARRIVEKAKLLIGVSTRSYKCVVLLMDDSPVPDATNLELAFTTEGWRKMIMIPPSVLPKNYRPRLGFFERKMDQQRTLQTEVISDPEPGSDVRLAVEVRLIQYPIRLRRAD